MRELRDILNDLTTAQQKYKELSSGDARVMTLHAQSRTIKELRKELDDALSSGAHQCPQCGRQPIGILRRPGFNLPSGPTPPLFEVGCVHCPPFLVEIEGKTMRQSYSSQGFSRDEAVANWNNGQFLIDGNTDRIPGGKAWGNPIALSIKTVEDLPPVRHAPRPWWKRWFGR